MLGPASSSEINVCFAYTLCLLSRTSCSSDCYANYYSDTHSSGHQSYRHCLPLGRSSLQTISSPPFHSLPALSHFSAPPLGHPLAPARLPNPVQRLASFLLQGLQRTLPNNHLGPCPAAQFTAALQPVGGSSASPCIQTPILSSGAVTLLGIQTKGQLLLSPTLPAAHACSRIRASRRSLYLPPSLPSTAASVLHLCLSHQLHDANRSDLLSPELVALVGSARKLGTVVKHSGYFAKWVAFMEQQNLPPLPIPPHSFAEFLVGSARKDTTASPTLSRCSAASYYSNLAAVPNPMAHPLCQLVRDALFRRLGLRGRKKSPLLRIHIDAIITRHLGASHSLETLLRCFHITVMYEGCLRWSDLKQLTFGDIVVSVDYLRLFIESAKNDQYRAGQWVTIATSLRPTSAYSLLLRLLESLTLLWSNASPVVRYQLASTLPNPPSSAATIANANTSTLPLGQIPLLFSITPALLPHFSHRVPY